MNRMKREEYLELHAKLCAEALELSLRKNHDYAGCDGNSPFANFERCELLGITTTTKGFLVRLTDKLSRLVEFSRSGTFAVRDESLRDTVLDVINYVCLLYAYETDRRSSHDDHHRLE